MKLSCLHNDLILLSHFICEGKGHQPTVAIDLDQTLTKDAHSGPTITSKPRKRASKSVKELKDAGFKIIIWTVRGNENEVARWLDKYGIPYDEINHNDDNPPDSSNKIIADLYVDDKSMSANKPWKKLVKKIKKRLNQK